MVITAKALKDLSNGNGDAEKGMICDVLKVWLNHEIGDIYVEIKFRANDLEMITSISNIEIIK
jgi:hypothetical protein